MNNGTACIEVMREQNLFVDAAHESRFRELIECYGSEPFFRAGLVKCMYLSAWDEEHFLEMLPILNEMVAGRQKSTMAMEDEGEQMEAEATGHDVQVMRLTLSFLNDEKFELGDEPIDEEGLRIISHALRAAEIIDRFFA